MSNYMKLLNIELQSIKEDDFIDARHKPEPNDQVVGKMTDSMKRIYTLWQQVDKRKDELKVEYKYTNPEVEQEKFKQIDRQLDELNQKTMLLNSLFWLEVKSEFSLFNKASVGVRIGFEIVWNDKPQMTLPPFLQGLIG